MGRKLTTMAAAVGLVLLVGCEDKRDKAEPKRQPASQRASGPSSSADQRLAEGGLEPSQAIQIEVVTAKEHLGHNLVEGDVHTVWCDGYRTRLADSGDPFVIYCINGQIEKTPFRFSEGREYTVWFTGEVEAGIMGYKGKCIDIRQVVRVEAK